jgi:hypothetical protein
VQLPAKLGLLALPELLELHRLLDRLDWLLLHS